MAWTANVTDSDENFVYLEFLEDGVRKFADKYARPSSAQALQNLVRDQIAKLMAKAAIAPGPVTPSAAPATDPDQSVKDTFLAQLFLRRQLQKAVDLGLVAANDSRVTQQINQLKATFDAQTQAVQLKIIQIL